MMLPLLFVFLPQGAGSTQGGVDYTPLGRVEYLASTLSDIRDVDAAFIPELRSYLDLLERSSCRSARATLRSRCFSVAASRRCRKWPKRAACGRIVDIVVASKLAERRFIPQRKRYKLMMQGNNYREAFRARLRQVTGRLGAEFALASFENCAAGEWRCWAATIDSYCIQRAGSHHLSWHYCAATLTLFIGVGADVPAPTWEEE